MIEKPFLENLVAFHCERMGKSTSKIINSIFVGLTSNWRKKAIFWFWDSTWNKHQLSDNYQQDSKVIIKLVIIKIDFLIDI